MINEKNIQTSLNPEIGDRVILLEGIDEDEGSFKNPDKMYVFGNPKSNSTFNSFIYQGQPLTTGCRLPIFITMQ